MYNDASDFKMGMVLLVTIRILFNQTLNTNLLLTCYSHVTEKKRPSNSS